MSASSISPFRAFLYVLLGALFYHVLFVIAGHYSMRFLDLPKVVGFLLFLLVPLLVSGLCFSLATRSSVRSTMLRNVLAFAAAIVSVSISVTVAVILQVSVWGM